MITHATPGVKADVRPRLPFAPAFATFPPSVDSQMLHAPHPAWVAYSYPTASGQPQFTSPPCAASPALPQQVMAPGKSPVELAAVQHNQSLLDFGIIAALSLIHLPGLAYLGAMHGCWRDFIDLCFINAAGRDSLDETPFLFARIAFFILRVQSTLAVDFQQFSQVMQIGTGLGSFALTKIVAANGTVVQGQFQRYGLAATCALAFVVLFWAELTLSGSANYPVLGDETVLTYIDSELPADFVGASDAKAGLMKYLQFLRFVDALIFGAALGMPKSPRHDPK